jgi:hypothetical protein
VTGVRGGRSRASSRTVLSVTVSPSHARPTPEPTLHWAPVTSPGRLIEISACSISLFHDGAITFQKNADGASCSPVDAAKRRSAAVSPGSSTPGMV